MAERSVQMPLPGAVSQPVAGAAATASPKSFTLKTTAWPVAGSKNTDIKPAKTIAPKERKAADCFIAGYPLFVIWLKYLPDRKTFKAMSRIHCKKIITGNDQWCAYMKYSAVE
jgi:hypothetical protein